MPIGVVQALINPSAQNLAVVTGVVDTQDQDKNTTFAAYAAIPSKISAQTLQGLLDLPLEATWQQTVNRRLLYL